MKLAGTLKCEIIKPINSDGKSIWNEVGPRLMALRKTLAPALTMTMRELYPQAVGVIYLFKSGNKDEARTAQQQWTGLVEKTLRKHWNEELFGRLNHLKSKLKEEDGEERLKTITSANGPIQEYLSSETRHNIISRWKGEPFKDLLVSKVSVPSWTTGCAFYARNRECPVSGDPDKARLGFPLFGGGNKRTTLVVAPCGDGHEALWKRLVAGEIKLGHVGISYNLRKHKWYALISWLEEREENISGSHVAAVNMGINVFLQAVSDDGSEFHVDGGDILATRRRFYGRRKSIQKSLDKMGRGAHGHGRNRLLRPITNLGDCESRYMSSKCRTVAAELIKWCVRHNIGRLILEDLSRIRETDEAKDTHEEVKRLIHSWPYAELTAAITRQGAEFGVSIETREAYYNSQRCPICGHTHQDNVRIIEDRRDIMVDSEGRRWERSLSKRSFFTCKKCDFDASGDLVSASNLLQSVTGYSSILTTKNKANHKATNKSKAKGDRAMESPGES
jgi:IS605 OrfB family transposase